MLKTLQVLIVEDSVEDADLLVQDLTKAGYTPRWSRVETEIDFVTALKERPDIVLCDYAMPKFSGLRALELLEASGFNIPLIIISGAVGEDVAVASMRFGASDYLLKGQTIRLPSAVERALKEKRFRAEQRLAQEKIKRQLEELQQWRDLTLGREDRIQSLKKEVNELLRLADKPPRYTDVNEVLGSIS